MKLYLPDNLLFWKIGGKNYERKTQNDKQKSHIIVYEKKQFHKVLSITSLLINHQFKMDHARSVHQIVFDILSIDFAGNHEKLGRAWVIKPDEDQG